MSRPLYRQIYERMREDILAGRLSHGDRLPSIRQMTRDSGVSRTTVETAYEQLCADGLVNCVPQSGYYVNQLPRRRERVHTAEPQPQKPRYDFSGKYLDPTSFDFDIWRRLSRAVMQDSVSFLGYGDCQGEYELRRQIARYLSAGRGVYASAENVVIGAGIQTLLSILCEMFDKSGRRIAFEDPGFQKGLRIFRDHNYEIVSVPGGASGIDIRALYESGANMLYISPSHSFPSGATLPLDKRLKLLEWAQSTGDGILFEDDYDGELRYTGKPLATLSSLDANGQVIYLGTFSKLLPPSIRISYAVLPDVLVPEYRRIAQRYNQTSSTMEQLTMARFIEEGRLEKQVRRLRRIYGRKNEAITRALDRQFGALATVRPNDTGLHLNVSLRISERADSLCARAEEHGLRIIPLSSYRTEGAESETADLYLSCAGIAEKDIEPAIRLLRELCS